MTRSSALLATLLALAAASAGAVQTAHYQDRTRYLAPRATVAPDIDGVAE